VGRHNQAFEVRPDFSPFRCSSPTSMLGFFGEEHQSRLGSLAKTSVSADNDDQADSDFFPHTTWADKLFKMEFQHLDNFSPPDKLDSRMGYNLNALSNQLQI
jgi:hypothetical protein